MPRRCPLSARGAIAALIVAGAVLLAHGALCRAGIAAAGRGCAARHGGALDGAALVVLGVLLDCKVASGFGGDALPWTVALAPLLVLIGRRALTPLLWLVYVLVSSLQAYEHIEVQMG